MDMRLHTITSESNPHEKLGKLSPLPPEQWLGCKSFCRFSKPLRGPARRVARRAAASASSSRRQLLPPKVKARRTGALEAWWARKSASAGTASPVGRERCLSGSSRPFPRSPVQAVRLAAVLMANDVSPVQSWQKTPGFGLLAQPHQGTGAFNLCIHSLGNDQIALADRPSVGPHLFDNTSGENRDPCRTCH